MASNLKATDAILDSLSKDKDSYVRQNVAKNPSNSGKVLEYLSHDESDSVRFEVARNENTLSETLNYLAYDEHSVIRRNVAINKNTLPKTLELLSMEQYDFGIRYFVAHNENTPEEVREYLKNALPKNTWAQTPTIEMLHDYEDDDWLNQWIANGLRKWIIGYHILINIFKIFDYLYCNLSKMWYTLINWLIFVSVVMRVEKSCR